MNLFSMTRMRIKKEYDFSDGKRGPVVQAKGKTRITIHLDKDVLAAFRDKAELLGRGYQTLINQALCEYLSIQSRPVDSETLRRIIREELDKAN
jgi:uncharacterized protein (DUF4415 family)